MFEFILLGHLLIVSVNISKKFIIVLTFPPIIPALYAFINFIGFKLQDIILFYINRFVFLLLGSSQTHISTLSVIKLNGVL